MPVVFPPQFLHFVVNVDTVENTGHYINSCTYHNNVDHAPLKIYSTELPIIILVYCRIGRTLSGIHMLGFLSKMHIRVPTFISHTPSPQQLHETTASGEAPRWGYLGLRCNPLRRRLKSVWCCLMKSSYSFLASSS